MNDQCKACHGNGRQMCRDSGQLLKGECDMCEGSGKEKSNSNKMKSFNLERALAGDPVITRNGRKVLQVAFFPDAIPDNRIVALIEKEKFPTHFFEDGKAYQDQEKWWDLFMAPKKKKLWIAINHSPVVNGCNEVIYATSGGYENLERIKIDYPNAQIVEVEIEE